MTLSTFLYSYDKNLRMINTTCFWVWDDFLIVFWGEPVILEYLLVGLSHVGREFELLGALIRSCILSSLED